MLKKIFLKLKSFISIFLICFLMLSSYNTERVNAIVGEEVLIISGVAFAPEVAVGLLIGAGIYLGYKVVDAYKEDLKTYMEEKLLDMGSDVLKSYFSTAVDSHGKQYLTLSQEAIDYTDKLYADIMAMQPGSSSFSVSSSKTTSDTTINSVSPYMLNGIYMTPLKMVSGVVVAPILVKAGDTITYQVYSSYADHTYSTTRTCGSDTYFRVYHYEHEVYIEGSFDGSFSPPMSFAYCNWGANGYQFDYGYTTTSNTVFVPGSTVINTGIETAIPSDATISVPISGQYDATTGSTVYTGVDGVTATAVSGLTAKDISTTTTGESTAEGTFWDQLWDWLTEIIDGIKAIPSSLIAWFTVDWNKVKLHINYLDIIKAHFKPILDLYNLFSNLSFNKVDSSGKFYMKIPKEMGGDDQEHCVLDLTVGALYITTARDFIKYGLWIFFAWYIFKRFDPKFSI